MIDNFIDFFMKSVIAALFAAFVIGGPAAAQQASDKANLPEAGTLKVATFAGGCFWCVESDFDFVPGVVKTISGYTGGIIQNPSYEDVVRKNTGHYEAVRIYYDPKKTTYKKLLDVFWHSVDPTEDGGQFCDRGDSYRTAIFAHSDEQLKQANASKKALEESGETKAKIVTPVLKAAQFWPAEKYHQDYYTKNPVRYKFYRFSCRRDARLKELWGDNAHRGIEKH